MPEPHPHVIVGGGLAGAKAAEALREEGYDGPVVLLGSEDEHPYERPPLSKDYLRGESEREKAHVHPKGFYEQHDIELRIATTVERIDPAGRSVTLAGGERLRYDRLLIATGSEPRRLRVPGAELAGVHYLRELTDADVLADRLNDGGRVVVIGAGWIGAEVAASARQKGLDVAMVEMGKTPLERVLGPEVGAIYAGIHRDHGVDLHTGVGVESLEGGSGGVERVRLADGRALECDFVVVGVGATPRTALAEQAGIAVDNGILVNDRLETSEAGVFAAGDVANAIHPFYRRLIRVEHWANALNQPVTAARAMLGKSASYDRLPYFYSDQFDIGMEYTGYATDWDEVVLRGDPAARELIAFWLLGGRVVAGMNMNVWDVTDPIKALIYSRQVVPVERLRDPGVPLEDLLAPAGVAGAAR
jgi:3-phenylpropionate/trans-cinnamate dioxygenase ferredoxin reductase component